MTKFYGILGTKVALDDGFVVLLISAKTFVK
jgi:hypothetical protein